MKWQPDIASLRMFVAVCEEGSISRAAERESVVPSAVSKRITEVELMTGTVLLLRGARGVKPTTAGLTLLRHARTILQSTAKLQYELGEYGSGVRGHVRVLANVSALAQSLPGDIAGFLRDHPTIRADIEERVSSAISDGLHSGVADIGVGLRTTRLDGLEVRPYATDRLMLIVHRDHWLAGRKSVHFEEVLDDDFVGLKPGSRMTTLLAGRAAALGRTINYRMQVSTYEAACKFIAEGLAIGVLAHASVVWLQSALDLRAVPLEDDWATHELILCARDLNMLPPAARSMFYHLESQGRRRSAVNDGRPSIL
ncbi:LysR family transcriptional regulator [Paraburkholderia tropica]|uniref:LysR family transcriptional regulator n=1 Tax=Paraburkholderia tropica TaxID=92647 RepID=UPI003018A166